MDASELVRCITHTANAPKEVVKFSRPAACVTLKGTLNVSPERGLFLAYSIHQIKIILPLNVSCH